MSLRPPPLRTVLDVEVDAVTTRRLWQRIAAKRAFRDQRGRRLSFLTAFVVGVAAAILVAQRIYGVRPELPPSARQQDAGILKLRGGEALGAFSTEGEPRTVELDDGSRIELGARGHIAPLENTNHSVVLFLQAGRAVFDVQHGGPRRWSIEAGLATVEVTGTRFTVQRSPTRVTVEVERGVVLVRGERVTDRVQRLGAGERLQIDQALQPADLPLAPPPEASAPHLPSRPSRNGGESSWRELARAGNFVEAYENLGKGGVSAHSKAADVGQLFALADVARYSGHPADAIEPLRRVVAEREGDPQAAVAALTLGRVHLDSLNDPASAARDFRDAISLGLPQALLEDAHLRLIEAHAKAGDRRAAHRAWEAYQQQFPNSPRVSLADKWGREP
jgi:transmembrane sensor